MKNLLIILSGPSGVGKGEIVSYLMADGNYALSVSCTTRAPRDGEVDGKSYFFISKEKFKEMIAQDGFLEYDDHFENCYGTPKAFVEERLKTHDVILEIEVNGALKVKETHPDVLMILILPPGAEELRKRLKKRGTESDEEIERRVARMEYEASKRHLYDYTVINDKLETAVAEIKAIIKSRKEI